MIVKQRLDVRLVYVRLKISVSAPKLANATSSLLKVRCIRTVLGITTTFAHTASQAIAYGAARIGGKLETGWLPTLRMMLAPGAVAGGLSTQLTVSLRMNPTITTRAACAMARTRQLSQTRSGATDPASTCIAGLAGSCWRSPTYALSGCRTSVKSRGEGRDGSSPTTAANAVMVVQAGRMLGIAPRRNPLTSSAMGGCGTPPPATNNVLALPDMPLATSGRALVATGMPTPG